MTTAASTTDEQIEATARRVLEEIAAVGTGTEVQLDEYISVCITSGKKKKKKKNCFESTRNYQLNRFSQNTVVLVKKDQIIKRQNWYNTF